MPIALPCPTCKAKLKGPDQLVGHTLKCPGCGTSVTITAAALVPIPAVAKTPKPPESKPLAPPSPPPPKPADTGFPNMEIDDNVGFQDDPVPEPAAAPPKKPAPKATKMKSEDAPEEEPFSDFEVIEDDEDEDVPYASLDDGAEVEVWVDPAQDEGEELEVVEDAELAEVLPADDGVEAIEVLEPAGNVSFRLLELPRLHVHSRSGMFETTNAYDLFNPKNKKKMGEAVERPEGAQQLLGMLAGKSLMSTKIEVRESRDNELVMTVRRAPYIIKARAEIFDTDDEKLGSFDILPFSALTGKPQWISDAADKQIIKLEMKMFSGRRYFRNRKDELLAEWVHEMTYEKKLKFRLAPRGNSFYLLFKEKLTDRPRERLLILGASLGLDLFQTAGQNRSPLLGR